MDNKLAIIVVNWKQYELTSKCLLSINKTRYKNFEIILVDNESNIEKLKNLVNNFETIKVFQNESNIGFGAANNQAINYAIQNNFEYLMLLNNDTEVDENYIDPLINTIDKNDKIGAVQPKIMNYNNKDSVWSAGGNINNFFGYTYTNKILNKNLKLDWITGCCILLKIDLIKKVGLFDENFFAYYEDVDWSLRIKDLGYSLKLVNSSLVYHHGSKSSEVSSFEGNLSPKVHYLNFKNHVYLLRKHINKFNFLGVILYQLIKLFSYSIYFILRFRFNKLRMIYKGINDGLKIEIK
jgi:GT2 family glycosyltransferase